MPSLKVAKKHFESSVVPRREDGHRYSIFWTSTFDLFEMGTGVGLYFLWLKRTVLILTVISICQISPMLYFSTADYNAGMDTSSLAPILRSSAVCPAKFVLVRAGLNNQSYVWAMHRDCDMSTDMGFWDVFTTVVLFLCLILSFRAEDGVIIRCVAERRY